MAQCVGPVQQARKSRALLDDDKDDLKRARLIAAERQLQHAMARFRSARATASRSRGCIARASAYRARASKTEASPSAAGRRSAASGVR